MNIQNARYQDEGNYWPCRTLKALDCMSEYGEGTTRGLRGSAASGSRS